MDLIKQRHYCLHNIKTDRSWWSKPIKELKLIHQNFNVLQRDPLILKSRNELEQNCSSSFNERQFRLNFARLHFTSIAFLMNRHSIQKISMYSSSFSTQCCNFCTYIMPLTLVNYISLSFHAVFVDIEKTLQDSFETKCFTRSPQLSKT